MPEILIGMSSDLQMAACGVDGSGDADQCLDFGHFGERRIWIRRRNRASGLLRRG